MMMSTPYPQHRAQVAWTELLLIVALIALMGFSLPVEAQADASATDAATPEIEDTRASLDAWLELRQTISKTTNEWKLTKEMMLDRIELTKSDIASIREEISKKKEDLKKFDTDIEALEAKEKSLVEASDKLAELIQSLEARTLALVERAPAPLAKQVNPIAVQIPGYKSKLKKDTEASAQAKTDEASPTEEKEEAKLPSLSRRTENVIGVLYQFNKFANKIEQIPQPVTQPDGSTLNVDTVFLGLSYAYFVDDSNTTGGFGWGAPGGWAWNVLDQPEVAANVRKAVSVFNDDEPAAYVGLPAEIK